MPDVVRVTNRGASPWRDMYANTPYLLRPGDSMVAPYPAACLWFGDPGMVDTPLTGKFDRRDEIDRVYARMGVYDGDGKSMAERFYVNRPDNVTVESLDGDRIYMLSETLDGSHTAPQEDSGGALDEKQALAQELERMKQMQAELLQRLSQLEAGESTFSELPTDTPTKVPIDEAVP